LFTIPNVLTLLRIVCTPWVAVLLSRGDYRLAFPLLMAVGLTDALDGFLARRFHWESRLGAYLDPAADKFMLAAVYLSFLLSGALPAWLPALVLLRDVGILLFVGLIVWRTRIRSFPPSAWGKISTFYQIGFAALVVLDRYSPGTVAQPLLAMLMAATAAATAWSGIDYLRIGIRMMKAV